MAFGLRRPDSLEALGQRFLIGLILVALLTITVGSESVAAVRHCLIWFSVASLIVITIRH